MRRSDGSGSGKTSWTAVAEDVIAAFVSSSGPAHRLFGSKSLGLLGVCDAVQGTQWSVATDLQSGRTWLAVNLEGMQYDGWPIARLIERELAEPHLPKLIRTLPSCGSISLTVFRDAWQAASRVRILERTVTPTPIELDKLSAEQWKSILFQALECLDSQRGFRGRARRTVTLAGRGEQVEREVSPHLNFQCDLARPAVGETWIPALAKARVTLEPLHEFTASRSAA